MNVTRGLPATAPGWWSAAGPVICPWCMQPHHEQAMIRCVACDIAVCAVCIVVSIDVEPQCPPCLATAGDP